MLKLILSTVLALSTVSLALAADNATTITTTDKHPLPVIVKNDLSKPGFCMLSFEDGSTKAVPCTHGAEPQQ